MKIIRVTGELLVLLLVYSIGWVIGKAKELGYIR
jgi:hypothetical protein